MMSSFPSAAMLPNGEFGVLLTGSLLHAWDEVSVAGIRK
jgi:hypothetical protein